jgi:hypothetical protein
MRIGNMEIKRRVWVGLFCALAVTAGWWIWSRNQVRTMTALASPGQPTVRLTGAGATGGDQAMREQAMLFDPAPLFFPTEWNYGQRPLPEALRRQPGQVFGSFDPKLTISDQDLKSYGKEVAQAYEKLADVLTQGNEAPFAGIGHVDVALPALQERDGYLEIRNFKDDKVIIGQALKSISLPRLDYAPLEFIIAISPAGIVGEPVLASGSGWEEVDAFFRAFLVKTFRVGERLSPGHYRVVVGP